MYHARVGPLDFTFCHAAVEPAPTVEGPVVGFVDEVPIRSIAVGHEWYLVIDHRPAPAADPVAYVEWWRPVTSGEMPLTWLLALTTASGQVPDPSKHCDRCAGERAADRAAAASRPPRPCGEPAAVYPTDRVPRMVV